MRIMYVVCAGLVACAADGGSNSDTTAGATSGALSVRWSSAGLTLQVPEALVGETLLFTQSGVTAELEVTKTAMILGVDMPAETFSPFIAGAVEWSAGTQSGTATLGERFTTFFQGQAAPDVTISGLPVSAAIGETIRVTGTAGSAGLRASAYVGLPGGSVTEVALTTEAALPSGAAFAFDVVVEAEGIYAVELLLPSGGPATVLPIYAGAPLPVLTPVLDRGYTGQKLTNLDPVRAEVLSRTNTLRASLGLPAVAEHPALVGTSQSKADDISVTKQFSHQSAALGGVTDQAKAAGLTGTVREALAVDVSAERAFYGWYWSPAHRTVLVDPSWRGQGVGVAWFNEAADQLVFVHHVSTAAP